MTYAETTVIVVDVEGRAFNKTLQHELDELRSLLSEVYGLKFDFVDQSRPYAEVWFLKNPMTSDTIWEGLADIRQDHGVLFEIFERE